MLRAFAASISAAKATQRHPVPTFTSDLTEVRRTREGLDKVTEDTPLRPLSGIQQAAISLALVSMGCGFSVNFVVVSPLALEAGLTPREIALVLVGSAALYAALTPVWGRLAERFGRKRVMAFSMFAAGITNAAFLFALDAALAGYVTGLSAFLLLAVVRLFFGALSPGVHPASMAAMADATTPKTRAAGMGLLGASMSIGSILGPAAIAFLVEFGRLAPLWGAIIFNILCAAVLMIVLPPTRQSRDGSGTKRTPPLKLTDHRVRPYLIFLLGYFTAIAAIQQSVAWLIQSRFGLDSEEAIRQSSYVFICLSIVMVAIQFGYIQPRKPEPQAILVPGLVVVSAGYMVAALAPSISIMCLGFAIVGVGAGLVVPAVNALGSMSVPMHEQGSAASLLAFAPPAGYVAGPILGAELYQYNNSFPLLFSSIVIGGLALVAYFLLLKKVRSQPR